MGELLVNKLCRLLSVSVKSQRTAWSDAWCVTVLAEMDGVFKGKAPNSLRPYEQKSFSGVIKRLKLVRVGESDRLRYQSYHVENLRLVC